MDVLPDRLMMFIKSCFRSQRGFASAMGVHETTVSYWLNGSRKPSEENLLAMESLGANLEFLAGNSPDMYANNEAGAMLETESRSEDGHVKRQGAINRHIDGGQVKTEEQVKSRKDDTRGAKRMDRSIEIGKITKDIPTAADITIPLHWQSVPAGDLAPIVTESFDEFNITKRYANTFAVYIRGESMVGAGIEDGDIAVFKEGMAPREGQVVYACVNNMCTVKVYTVAPDGHVVLTPANEKYQPIDVKDGDVLSIRGVMVNLVREPKPYREPKSHSKK